MVANALIYAVLGIIGISMLLPIVAVIFTSVSPQREILKKGMVLFPTTGFSIDAYKFILQKGTDLPKAYGVSVFVTTIGTVVSLTVSAMMAYGLSKRILPGGRVIKLLVLFTMLFSGGLIPTYMVVKGLGLINSLWALILPGLVSVWNMLVLISFFNTVPESLEQSAKLEGCNDLVIFMKIIVPISVPAMVTIGMFYAVGYWNSWFPAVIYINDRSKWPLQMLLRNVIQILDFASLGDVVDDATMTPSAVVTVKAATIVATMLPILVIYPFAQRYFIKGILIGAVKE